jgi:Glycosyl transferase family 90
MIINKLQAKFLSILILIIIFCSVMLFSSPKTIISVYGFLYTKYVKIFKRNLSSRFSKKQLDDAILYAKNQAWVKQQISEDLEPFKQGISAEKIDYWFAKLQHNDNKLIKFTIKNNQIIQDVPTELTKIRSYITIYQVIKILTDYKYIPDCKFIVGLNDYLIYIPEDFKEPVAMFSFAKHTKKLIENSTILIPDWMNISYWDVLRDRIKVASYFYPWHKKLPLIHWRGGWADSMQHRSKLMSLKNTFTFLDVGMTQGKFAVPFLNPEYSLKYKYQLSLDGARATWERVVWQMHSNSLLIKPDSPHIQWFYKGLKPYVNYVPINDINEPAIKNLYDWLINHDDKVKNIIINANIFANNNLKTQDFLAYYVVLLQEYAKLIN